MANEKANHLSTEELVNCYYELPVSSEISRHLADCPVCQQAYADMQRQMAWVAADYRDAAMEGLDAPARAREVRAIMARLQAPPPVTSFLFAHWRGFAAAATLLVALSVGLALYTQERQYNRLWAEAGAVVQQVGPVGVAANEFTAVFDESSALPGFPVEPEPRELTEAFGD